MSSTSTVELETVPRLSEYAIRQAVTGIGVVEATGNVSPPSAAATSEPAPIAKPRSAALMATVSCVSFLNTFNSGVLTVAVPVIAKDLNIADSLLLWPASVYALAMSCTLLLIGAIADVVGNRPVFLVGSVLLTGATLAVSLARSANQFIAFRAVQGLAMAFCMPTSVSIITTTFPSGKQRNVAFAIFGGGSPIGFALGLVLGGVFTQASGWRTPYYMSTAISAITFVIAWATLPKPPPVSELRRKLRHNFDWVGVVSANVCLGLLSYVFAVITGGASSMKQGLNIALLAIAVGLIPFFIFWMSRQERLGRPAILPNSIWRRREFTTVCVTVFLVWAWFNAFGYWATLFFQVTQGLDALQAALRFLPMVIVGVAINVVAGLTMDKVSAGTLVLISGVLSAISPLLFAIQRPDWMYWAAGFPAICLSPISTDLLFNISNLVITSNFPSKDQALAGSVFNTVTQLGNSIGPAITAIIAASVTNAERDTSAGNDFDATLKGYRSALWACFGVSVVSTIVSAAGLRRAGKVGLKKDV